MRFLAALRNNVLLSAKLSKRLFSPHVVESDDRARGYDWRYGYSLFFLLQDDHVVRYGLPGEEDGVSCRLFHYPNPGPDLIVLGNESGCARGLGWDLHDVLTAINSRTHT